MDMVVDSSFDQHESTLPLKIDQNPSSGLVVHIHVVQAWKYNLAILKFFELSFGLQSSQLQCQSSGQLPMDA